MVSISELGKKIRSTAYFKVIKKIIFKDIYNLFFSCLGLICSNVSLKGRGCCFGWLKKVVFFFQVKLQKKIGKVSAKWLPGQGSGLIKQNDFGANQT